LALYAAVNAAVATVEATGKIPGQALIPVGRLKNGKRVYVRLSLEVE
jgi:hypothetical protein